MGVGLVMFVRVGWHKHMRLRMFWLTASACLASACLSVAECSCLTQLGTSCWKRQKRNGTNKLKKTCLSKLKHTRRKKNKKMVPPKSTSQQTDARNSVQSVRQKCVCGRQRVTWLQRIHCGHISFAHKALSHGRSSPCLVETRTTATVTS